MPKNKLTIEQKESIIKLYQNGESANKISKKFPISANAIYRLLKKSNIPIRSYSQASRKYSLNENYFKLIDNPNKAYFLGFLIADGYNNVERNCVELSSSRKDKNILEMLNKEIGSNKPVRDIDNNGILSSRIDWCSAILCKDLENHGCMQNKTFKIKMPNLQASLMRHFLRGYFDGDGCVSYSFSKKDNFFGNVFNSVATVVGTEDFCIQLKNLILEKISVNSTILCRNPESPKIKTIQISGNNQVIKFMEWIYDDAELFMERKRVKINEIKNILLERRKKINQRDKKKDLLKLTEIVNNKEELWKSRYWITRGEIECESGSKFTKLQSEILIKKLKEYQGKEVIGNEQIEDVFLRYRKNGFPYYQIDQNEFKKAYNALKETKVSNYWDGYGTQFATCFHKHIFDCYKPGKLSAKEIFDNDNLFKICIKKAIALNNNISDSTIRNICRNEKRSSRINNFPPRVALNIIKSNYQSPISVLDPCAGFSGRLLGCASSQLVKKYVGCDISRKTYQGLVETKKNIELIDNFINIELYNEDCLKIMQNYNDFDCILTSPPFLDVEIYDGVEFYEDYEKWEKEFILPFIKLCFNSLKKNGKMFIYLEKIRKIDFPNNFSILAEKNGFKRLEPIKFNMSYGENNRSNKSKRTVNILVLQKEG